MYPPGRCNESTVKTDLHSGIVSYAAPAAGNYQQFTHSNAHLCGGTWYHISQLILFMATDFMQLVFREIRFHFADIMNTEFYRFTPRIYV